MREGQNFSANSWCGVGNRTPIQASKTPCPAVRRLRDNFQTSGRSFDRPPKELSALNHLSLKPFPGTLLVEMLSAISISRFACIEPRKTFVAVGTALFRVVCINSRRFKSKVRHHSLPNTNLKRNTNIEAKVVPSATSKQMYRATVNGHRPRS